MNPFLRDEDRAALLRGMRKPYTNKQAEDFMLWCDYVQGLSALLEGVRMGMLKVEMVGDNPIFHKVLDKTPDEG